jgi:hypothetical protein
MPPAAKLAMMDILTLTELAQNAIFHLDFLTLLSLDAKLVLLISDQAAQLAKLDTLKSLLLLGVAKPAPPTA